MIDQPKPGVPDFDGDAELLNVFGLSEGKRTGGHGRTRRDRDQSHQSGGYHFKPEVEPTHDHF